MTYRFLLSVIGTFIFFYGCSETIEKDLSTTVIFQQLDANVTGIEFNNKLTETDSINYFTYPYIYMGGGVATGDLNGDGLPELFFTGNMVANKLYMNKGDLKFTDITVKSGVAGDNRWMTGATMADINNDGLLDIYVSVSGKFATTKNLLYINQGNDKDEVPIFKEEAERYGIADNGQSTQATFFDYDLDGDLDLYVANYPITKFTSLNSYYKDKMDHSAHEDADHLYRNDGEGVFTDVTEEAGVMQFGLSLSATVADINQDGYPDIYISNDFVSPDYFYINNGDGTFSEKSKELTKHTSFYGMGVDIADFNNDGLLDIVQMDMTPEDNRRSKANMAGMSTSAFEEAVTLGFHHQYMKNSLQVNNGLNADGNPIFSEISSLSGIATTDWSWAGLFADLDNDGLKDLFITNGSRRDINNKDYFKKIDESTNTYFKKDSNSEISQLGLVDKMPSEKLDNYAYKNNGDLTFTKNNKAWGISFKGFSNGAAYADLDNDGDLEVIINNIDDKVSIFKNLSSEKKENNYLRFKMNGPALNPFGLGVKITISNGESIQFNELTLTRGFQSSVAPILHFGLGKNPKVDTVVVTWPDGKTQELTNIKSNQLIRLNYADAKIAASNIDTSEKHMLLSDITDSLNIAYKHIENRYNDYLREPLLPHQTSRLGPGMAVGDVNNDGLDDFYIGGAAKSSGALFIQKQNGLFQEFNNQPWQADKEMEDVAASFFDANGDGHIDLYVVSGGNEFLGENPLLMDRLYLNDGKGHFTKTTSVLPNMLTSGGTIAPYDYDNDGDIDLFVGGRLVPENYPLPARSYILENKKRANGEFYFEDVTASIAPDILEPGMVTAAVWTDFNNDKTIDLVITGEWMPLLFLKNEGNKFVNMTDQYGLDKTTGWWNSLIANDFDNDGDIDFVAGNLGLNYKYKASEKESFDIYAGDFDKNQRLDIVLGYYSDGTQFPVRGRQCSSEAIVSVRLKYESYDDFAESTLQDVYSSEALGDALHYKVWTFASSYIENKGDGEFKVIPLPNEAQLSSVNGILTDDYNQDGYADLFVVGNFYASEVETPRNDAGIGLIMYGDGKGGFDPVSAAKSGLYAPYDTRKALSIHTAKGKVVLLANNNDSLRAFRVRYKK